MRILFYAPFKPLDHPQPSGDWVIATGLYNYLIKQGHAVQTASSLRCRWIYWKPWLWIALIWERRRVQQQIAHRIDTRYTPRLRFVLDQGVKRSIEVSRILDEVLPRPAPADEDDEEFDAELDGADTAESLDDLWDSPDQPEHDANESR